MTMMRIPTLNFFNTQTEVMNDQYTNVYNLQQSIQTLQKYQRSSQDIITATQATPMQQYIDELKNYASNAAIAKDHLSTFDSAISKGVDLATKVQQTLVAAKSDNNSDAQRKDYAIALQGYLSQLLNVANTRDSNNQYIFAGANSGNPAFVFQNGQYVYQGSTDPVMVTVSPTDQVIQYDSGYSVFSHITAGNGTFIVQANSANTGTGYTGGETVSNPASYVPDTYTISFQMNGGSPNQLVYIVTGAASGQVVPPSGTPVPAGAPVFTPGAQGGTISFNGATLTMMGNPAAGDTFTVSPSPSQDLFDTIQTAINALNTPLNGNAQLTAQFHQTMNQVSESMNQAFSALTGYQGTIGVRMSNIDTVMSEYGQILLNEQNAYGKMTGTDVAAASSELAQALTSLQATQLAYVKIQNIFSQLFQVN